MNNIRKTLISIAFFLFFFSLISNVEGAVTISGAYPSASYAFSKSYVIFYGLVYSSTSSVINCTLLVDNVQRDIAYNIANNTYFYLNTTSLSPGKHSAAVRCTDNGWISNATYSVPMFYVGGLLTECNSRLVESGGYYYMSSDILDTSSWAACFIIMNNSITINCNNKRLVKYVALTGLYLGIGYTSGSYNNITIGNCSIENWDAAIYMTSGNNVDIHNIYVYNSSLGIYIPVSGVIISNIFVMNSSTYGVTIGSNSVLRDSIITDSGTGVYLGNNATSINVTVANSTIGFYAENSNSSTLVYVTSMYNTDSGLYIESSNASVINSSFIFNNIGVEFVGTIKAYVNISGANISSNNIGLYVNTIGILNLTSSIISNNTNYGIYGYPATTVYNNILNNTVNYMPVNYGSRIVNWNTTLQPGYNIWNSSLGYIGGNLWTNPDGNGYSDICNDTDYNGFCDDPYIINSTTGDIDYLPIAKYVGQVYIPPSFSVVFSYDSVDFGTVTPNTIAEAKSINYNVSITSASDYRVSVNATDWSGAATIPANTLYFAVNDTLDKLSFATAKQLSNSVQQVAVFSSTVTTNYHAFYFIVPVVPIGTYTATVTITYEVV